MIKKFGYYIFAAFFSLFRLCPLNKDKVFLVATHDDGPEGNIGLMVEYIKKERAGTKFVYLTKEDGIRKPFSFFFANKDFSGVFFVISSNAETVMFLLDGVYALNLLTAILNFPFLIYICRFFPALHADILYYPGIFQIVFF